MEEEKRKQALMGLIGNNVRKCRMERGMTQEELANKINAAPSTIARIEGGSRMMSILSLQAVAQALNVSYDALLRGSDPDARLENILVKLSHQTADDLAHLEQIIQSILDYGSRNRDEQTADENSPAR